MTRTALLLLFAASASAAVPFTTAHDGGWGVDDRTPAFGGGVTATELPPALRGAARVEVPRQLLGRPVTAIAPALFEGCTNLVSAALPPSLRAIPPDAFRGCRRLREAPLPDAVAEIGERAFADCPALRRVVLPPGVRRLGEGAFAGCAALREADLGACAEIGDGAFGDCARLERVRFPAAPGGSVGAGAFRGCLSLREVAMPEGPRRIGAEAFGGCLSLRQAALPSSLESVGARAFAGCTALQAAAMPPVAAGAESGRPFSLGEAAFEGCTALREAAFGAGGRLDLGDAAFADCASLRSARLAGTAGRVGEGLFRGCRSLREADVPPGATELPPACFRDCSALVSLELPVTLVSLGRDALRGCASLRRLDLPPQFSSFGDDALRGCTALRRLELPSASVRFGHGAVAGCDALLVAWRSADPATEAGIPAARLAAGRVETAGPAAPAAGLPRRAAAPPAAGAWEEAGGVFWRWRPAAEGDGAEILDARARPDAAPFEGGRPDVLVSLSVGRRDLASLSVGRRDALDVAVPETLGGLPVAALGAGALAQMPAMRLVVPASVRRVGPGAVPAHLAERLVFLGPPPAFAPDWAAPAGEDAEDPAGGAAAPDPFDWLEHPVGDSAGAAAWAALLAPALPSAEPAGAAPPAETFVAEELAGGRRWTYSVRDGFAWAGGGPGRPALRPEDAAGDLAVPETLGGLPVRGLARGALRGCTALRSLRVGAPGGRFEIGVQALRDCTALTNVSRAADCALDAIGAEALRGCTALVRFDAAGCSRFGAAAFAGCTALRSLRVGAAAGSGGPDSLPPLFAAGCRSLEEVELPVAAVGRGAFRGCTSLRAAWAGRDLRILGAEAFAGCTALRRADLPAGCTRIGPDAFDRCPLLDR